MLSATTLKAQQLGRMESPLVSDEKNRNRKLTSLSRTEHPCAVSSMLDRRKLLCWLLDRPLDVGSLEAIFSQADEQFQLWRAT